MIPTQGAVNLLPLGKKLKMTVFSHFLDSKDKIMEGIKQQGKIWPPPIPFISLKSKKTNGKSKATVEDSDGEDKTKYLTVKVKFNPMDKDSEDYDEKIFKFSNRTPEEWLHYCKQMDKLFEKLTITDDPERQHGHYQATLHEDAKENTHKHTMSEAWQMPHTQQPGSCKRKKSSLRPLMT